MQTYLEIGEFCKLVHLSEDVVKGMMANGALNFKDEDGKIYIEANQGTFSVVPKGSSEATPISSISLAGESFVEKTIGTILNLHEKVLDAKDETLETLKNENKFLKDVLYSMQEIYDEDRKTIDILNEQLGRAQEEVEFLKRKYKLMWNKAVDNFTQGKMSATMDDDMENSAFSPRSERNSSINSSLNSALNSGANSNENLSANSGANSALKAAASAALHAETPKSESANSSSHSGSTSENSSSNSTPKAENLSTTQSTANSNATSANGVNSNPTAPNSSENSSLNSSASSTANSSTTANSATNSSENSNANSTNPQKDSAQ